MIYRKIKEEEQKDFAKLSATAFHSDAKEQYDDINEGGYLPETIRVLEDKSGKFAAGLRLIEMGMYLDTGYVKCGGIGDVSSYPEYRRTGKISELMKKTLREMYDDNYVISYLYPFSFPFYRKYGYELSLEKQIVTIETKNIEFRKPDGYVKQHVPKTDNDLSEDIKKVYSKHAEGKNLMVNRKGFLWKRKLKHDPFTTKIRTYVYYNKENDPVGYVHYEYEKLEMPNIKAIIYDLAFVDRKTFDDLLMFVYMLGPAISEISFSCPPSLKIFNAMTNAWDVKMKVEPAGMLRIINVKKAFESMKAVEINDTLLIKTIDNNIEENTGTFEIRSEDGKIKAQKIETNDYDLYCPISILAQLVSGLRIIDDVIHMDSVEVKSKKAELDKLFYKKHLHIQDYF